MPRRRFLRFSLRTLFVALTLLGLAFAWLLPDWQIVTLRDEALATAGDWPPRPGDEIVFFQSTYVGNRPKIPLARRLLGDVEVAEILLIGPNWSAGRREEIRDLFPEAAVLNGSRVFRLPRYLLPIKIRPPLSALHFACLFVVSIAVVAGLLAVLAPRIVVSRNRRLWAALRLEHAVPQIVFSIPFVRFTGMLVLWIAVLMAWVSMYVLSGT